MTQGEARQSFGALLEEVIRRKRRELVELEEMAEEVRRFVLPPKIEEALWRQLSGFRPNL